MIGGIIRLTFKNQNSKGISNYIFNIHYTSFHTRKAYVCLRGHGYDLCGAVGEDTINLR